MIPISKRGRVKSSALWAASLTMLALLYTPASPGFWSGVGWALDRREAPRHPKTPTTGQPASPDPAPVALPVREPTGGALGTALVSCDKESESSEKLLLYLVRKAKLSWIVATEDGITSSAALMRF
jgi:hypothetical protein